jgi:hypothetical protein
VVDGTGLENRHTRKGIGGSNPSLSAIRSCRVRSIWSFAPLRISRAGSRFAHARNPLKSRLPTLLLSVPAGTQCHDI